MPWCDGCDRFYNPNTLRSDGSCPVCGRVVADPPASAPAPASAAPAVSTVVDERSGVAADGGEVDAAPAPWHFKVLVVAVVVYLGWRLIQGVDAVIGWL